MDYLPIIIIIAVIGVIGYFAYTMFMEKNFEPLDAKGRWNEASKDNSNGWFAGASANNGGNMEKKSCNCNKLSP